MSRMFATILTSMLLAACSVVWPLKPVATEWPLLGPALDSPLPANTQRVLIFNNSGKLQHGTSNTGRINVWLNGRGVAGLDIGEYVQLALAPGTYTLQLLHHDLVDFKSTHEVIVKAAPVYVEVSATITSNSVTVHASLPQGNALPMPFRAYAPR